ncbi:MAG: class I SAM-dependent methyltransferase [Chlorobi bacterium]|nr:class I SAM-dependent methyltransferase [Chlorobiota bacterium]
MQQWFKKWFNTQEYSDLYKHRDETDAKKIVSLILKNIKLKKDSKVLDLACGNGRHSVLFAKKGFKVLGIDLSPFLISQAKGKLKTDYKKFKNNLRFEIRDMRGIRRKNEFDLVVNLFTSFGYFEKDSENFRVIKSISSSLKKGGHFFLDFLNPPYLKRNLVPFDMTGAKSYLKSTGNPNIIIQVREIKAGFVKKNILILKNLKNSKYPQIYNFYEKIKLYSLSDLRRVFNSSGLKIKKVFGNYYGSKYEPVKSERLIILAQKK